MGWAIMFLVLIALVIILSISLINWKMQIHKVNVQLNAILNGETKKLVTISLTDRRLEHLVEIINQILLMFVKDFFLEVTLKKGRTK